MIRRLEGVAEYVIFHNKPYYTDELLSLIPPEMLDVKIGSETSETVIAELSMGGYIFYWKMATAMGLSKKWEENRGETDALIRAINSPINSLSPELEQIRKKIKFFFNVASIIAHW